MYFLDNSTIFQSFLQASGICPHQSAGPQKNPSEIPGDYCCHIVNIFSQDHIQHWSACCSGWFSVITASGVFPVLSHRIYIAVMSGIPVFLLHFFYKSKCLFFGRYGAHCSDKPGLFLHHLAFTAFVNCLIFL